MPYRLRPVDMLAGVENDPEFLAINPAGFIPGDPGRRDHHGRVDRHPGVPDGPLRADAAGAGTRDDPALSGLSAVPAPGRGRLGHADVHHRRQPNPRARGRARQLGRPEGPRRCSRAAWAWSPASWPRAPYMAGERFTAADISVTYALEFAHRTVGYPLGEAEWAYIDRTTARDGYKRAMEVCQATKAWAESKPRR
ncbi:glutathione S-transferase family protein [Caulobacter segnis]